MLDLSQVNSGVMIRLRDVEHAFDVLAILRRQGCKTHNIDPVIAELGRLNYSLVITKTHFRADGEQVVYYRSPEEVVRNLGCCVEIDSEKLPIK